MNITIVRFFASVMVSAFACSLMASGDTGQKAMPVVKTDAKKAPAKAATVQLHGTVASISGDMIEVTVGKTGHTAVDTIYKDDKTTVFKGTAAAAFTDLQAGASVTIRYKKEGARKIALKITEAQEVKTAKAAK